MCSMSRMRSFNSWFLQLCSCSSWPIRFCIWGAKDAGFKFNRLDLYNLFLSFLPSFRYKGPLHYHCLRQKQKMLDSSVRAELSQGKEWHFLRRFLQCRLSVVIHFHSTWNIHRISQDRSSNRRSKLYESAWLGISGKKCTAAGYLASLRCWVAGGYHCRLATDVCAEPLSGGDEFGWPVHEHACEVCSVEF